MAKRRPARGLLVAKALIRGDEHVERVFGRAQELAVLEPRPPQLVGGCNSMTLDETAQGSRDALIEEDPHTAGSRLSEAQLSVLEDGFDLLAGNAGEPVEEIVHARTRFEVLEQRLDRHTRALEYPGTTHLARVALDCGAAGPVQHMPRVAPSTFGGNLREETLCVSQVPPAPLNSEGAWAGPEPKRDV